MLNSSFPMTTTEASSPIVPPAVTFRYIGIVVACLVIPIGSIGNLLTILAYISNKKLQTSFNVLVVNLSVVDFISAALMLPFNLAGYIKMEWPFGNDAFTARLQAFFYFFCGYTSVVCLVVITINRFIGVFWPSKYNDLFSFPRMVIAIVFCWTFPAICLLPFLVGTHSSCPSPNHALTGFKTQQFVCTFICLPNEGWDPYMQWTRVMFQFIPVIVMIVAYGAILYKINRKDKQMQRTLTMGLRKSSVASTIAMSTNSSPSAVKPKAYPRKGSGASIVKLSVLPKKKSSQNLRRTQNNRRMLVISVVICIGFMITFLPSVIVNLIPGSRSFDPRIHMLASNFTWLNSALNPIIYVILNKRFRREYIRLVKIMCGRVTGGFFHESNTTGKDNGHAGLNSASSMKETQRQKFLVNVTET